MIETKESCDCCREDIFDLSHDGGVTVYRGKFNSFWKWRGRSDEPKGPVTVCGDCWRAIGRAVVAGRVAPTKEETGGQAAAEETPDA